MIGLLLLLFAQDSAEATFQRIEAALAKADTIKVTVKGKAVMTSLNKSMSGEIEGTLLIKGENKVKVTMIAKEGDEPPHELNFVSDGVKMRGPGATATEVPKDLRKSLLTVLPRLGGLVTLQTAMTIGAGRPKETDPVASNFTSSGPELKFDVAYDGSTWKATFGFDEKTHKLLKLEARKTPTDPKSPGKAGVSRLITESIQVETGLDIPDKEFELPKEKPAK